MADVRVINCSKCGTEADYIEEQDWGTDYEFVVDMYKCPNECVHHIEVPRMRKLMSNELKETNE